MEGFWHNSLDFAAQFTGGRGGIDHVVNHGIGSILFGLLLAVAIFQRHQSNAEREKLLAWGFGLGLGRELFMVMMAYIQAIGLISPEVLHVFFPPLEHALSNIATITIAAAFIRYLLNDLPRSKFYLQAGIASVLLCYLATFIWWGRFILVNPASKFGQTWCDWLFRINASVWMFIPIVWLLLKTKGWLRNVICSAFTLFFLNEFLKIPDMALGEVYEHIFAPFRHGFYLIAVLLFGYVYIREMYEDHVKAEEGKKRLQKQLSQSQKLEAIGTLAGGIAHDFNNILGAIIGFADMAQDDLPEDSRTRSDLDRILRAGHRAKDLVHQILTFSRQQEEDLQPIHIQYVINEAIKLLRSTTPASISVKPNICKECRSILANATMVHQILLNLYTNAVQAMGEKGEVRLSLKEVSINQGEDQESPFPRELPDGDYLKLTISDTGPGIAPDIKNRIFEPFFTTKDPGHGTGMGLAVVYGIVQKFNGLITVDSEPGKGTTFEVYFPVIGADAKQETESHEPILTGSESILLIDDEMMLAHMGKQMLEKFGYTVTTRTSSVEALAAFQAQPEKFDLVVTDQTMPNLTGTELAQKIKEIRPDIPIILCTGYSAYVNEGNAAEFGLSAFVMKPLDKKVLTRTIRQVLDEKSRCQQEQNATGSMLALSDQSKSIAPSPISAHG